MFVIFFFPNPKRLGFFSSIPVEVIAVHLIEKEHILVLDIAYGQLYFVTCPCGVSRLGIAPGVLDFF